MYALRRASVAADPTAFPVKQADKEKGSYTWSQIRVRVFHFTSTRSSLPAVVSTPDHIELLPAQVANRRHVVGHPKGGLDSPCRGVLGGPGRWQAGIGRHSETTFVLEASVTPITRYTCTINAVHTHEYLKNLHLGV